MLLALAAIVGVTFAREPEAPKARSEKRSERVVVHIHNGHRKTRKPAETEGEGEGEEEGEAEEDSEGAKPEAQHPEGTPPAGNEKKE